MPNNPVKPIFDPIHCTEVMNRILSRRGLKMVLTPKSDAEKHGDGSTDQQPGPQPRDRAG